MKELKQYYRDIYNALPYDSRKKKDFLHQLKNSVDSFLLEYPDADIATVRQHFGAPEQIVNSCFEALETTQVLNKIKLNKKIVKIVTAIAVCALLLWGVVLGIALMDNISSRHGFYSNEVTSSKMGD